MQDLQKTMDEIVEKFVFDAASYPELQGKSIEETFRFAVRHSALHMSKSLGKVATFCEDIDHGETGDKDLLMRGTIKMFINTLRLAELQGVSAERLLTLTSSLLRE